MKLNEIIPGEIYWYGGPVLVLDVGLYRDFRDSQTREVTVKGLTIRTDHWFAPDPNAKQRRVVVLMLQNGGRIVTMTAAKLSSATGMEQQVKDRLEFIQAERTAADEIRKWETRRREYDGAVREICLAVAGFDDVNNLPWRARHGEPLELLAENKELMSKMLLLWLQYHQQTGQEIAGAKGEDIESMVDSLRDALRGLKGASLQSPNPNDVNDPHRIAAQAVIDAGWNTPKFTATIVTA